MQVSPRQVEAAVKAMSQIVGGLATIATMFLAWQQEQSPSDDNIVDFNQHQR